MKIFAKAKINLCLDILEKSPNGYHKIQTVYKEIDFLKNEIEIFDTEKEQKIASEAQKLSPPCEMAIQIIKKRFKIKKNPGVNIKRNIPYSSGLGGESSNAAAILKALNNLWALGLSNEELRKIAAEIGMDVPFFIEGGLALGTNFGEELSPLENIDLNIKLSPKSAKIENKTVLAYSSLDLKKCAQNTAKTEKLLEGIANKNPALIKANLHNDFETIYPVRAEEHLSGSGPSTFKLEI